MFNAIVTSVVVLFIMAEAIWVTKQQKTIEDLEYRIKGLEELVADTVEESSKPLLFD